MLCAVQQVLQPLTDRRGYPGVRAAYHHGEASLAGTIVGLAQDFVGSNNINYLVPQGACRAVQCPAGTLTHAVHVLLGRARWAAC